MLRWPDRAVVERALRQWVAEVVRGRGDVVRVGAFGSFARGDWAFGSDLDLIIIVRGSHRPFAARASAFDATRLPVPADLLVYTAREWDAMRAQGHRFHRAVAAETKWLYPHASDEA